MLPANGITRRCKRFASALPSTAKGRSVQFGETPDGVAQSLRISRWYGCLAWYRRGGWDGWKAQPRFKRPPKPAGNKPQWVYDPATRQNPRH